MSVDTQRLKSSFNDPDYAWELLEWEIAIEMNDSLSGEAIAHLLELYMRGVQKMNSIVDIRESYFKNKVTSLMMKSTVVKTLNKAPMAKKGKPLEANAKQQLLPTLMQKGEAKGSKKREKTPSASSAIQPINPLALQQKRKEIEMRLAYEADVSSRENLTKIYDSHLVKEEKYNHKVKGLISDHESRLKDRIMKRKLRTSTNRSRADNTNDTFPIDEAIIKKQYEETFSPREHKKINEGLQITRKSKSLEDKVKHDLKAAQSPKRQRKNTHDYTQDGKQLIDMKRKQIADFQQFIRVLEQQKRIKGEETVLQMVIKEEDNEGSSEGAADAQQLIENRQSI